ncbi:type II toxin-antitoxin system RelB/DinJ family antitoxin [Synergistaceae bacterium OttesenSCG-928-D05]|nr:type II toxin-antitoxin system RelB/DinJ family antitoxin [Synergistaceae bacterium OttesenSCG-928-D05]
MSKSEVLQVRLTPELRKEADELFSSMGLETREAVRLFIVQTIAHGALPFAVIPPKKDANGFTAAQRKRLDQSIAELEAGHGQERELIEA